MEVHRSNIKYGEEKIKFVCRKVTQNIIWSFCGILAPNQFYFLIKNLEMQSSTRSKRENIMRKLWNEKKLNCENYEKSLKNLNMGKYHIYYYVAGILNFCNIFPAEHIL